MHDHSRFQRDINDVTGVSLSLSLSLSQKSLTHNIGSASALPIICLLYKFSQYFLLWLYLAIPGPAEMEPFSEAVCADLGRQG